MVLSEQNEARLPKAIKLELDRAKKVRKHVHGKDGSPYYLVEYLGVHQFDWLCAKNIFRDVETEIQSWPLSSSLGVFPNNVVRTNHEPALEEIEDAKQDIAAFQQGVLAAMDDEDEERPLYPYSFLACTNKAGSSLVLSHDLFESSSSDCLKPDESASTLTADENSSICDQCSGSSDVLLTETGQKSKKPRRVEES